MRKVITGEQVAQIYNPDPFALPAWRAPVYRTPAGIVAIVQLYRLLAGLVRLVARHPLTASVLALLALTWVNLGWIGIIGLAAWVGVVLAAWRFFWPSSFARWVTSPARRKWRTWFYRRRWAGVMTIADLAPQYQGRILLPVLGKVTATRYTDRIQVRLVSGQSAADFAQRAENLAHGFGALLCRVRSARSGAVLLEFVRRDALAAVVPALPVPAYPDLKALPVGRREDGLPWLVKLHGTHVLIAGATGAGKASLLWSLVRAMFPLMQAGLVRMLAADPKLMELAYGRVIFDMYVPCGHTLASVCPSCAERARLLRAAQCREGWHLEDEPDITPDPATGDQQWWVVLRAEAQQQRDTAAAAGADTTDFDLLITELDEEIAKAGIRGKVNPDRPARRHRSTRRRQDAPDLPRRKVTPRTVGKTYTAPDGKTFRPSMFVTLTCPSYGRVGEDGAPTDPAAYEYDRAARDALAFAALFDRFMQNLRRYLGYEVQYFAAVEPQRRLAPHIHIATRGTISRAEIRRVLAATYHQVWWPSTTTVKYAGDELPVWDESTSNYLDPATGEVLPTWDQALDAIGPDDEPWHVARFGDRFDAQGVLSGSKDAGRCIGYLTKYLTKQVADCHQAETDAQRAHAARLAEALRYQPCSPRCANWLRYGIQPKGTRPGLVPGCCKGKAHDADHLGYGGRRVLVSRKWSGKTLADHRADRKDWLLATLGIPATDPARYAWEPVAPTDPDHMEHSRRLLHVVADRQRWQNALAEARRKAAMHAETDVPATGRAA